MTEARPVELSRELEPDLVTDLLILSDGTVLAHNLTPVMAALLATIHICDETVEQRRPASATYPRNELPD